MSEQLTFGAPSLVPALHVVAIVLMALSANLLHWSIQFKRALAVGSRSADCIVARAHGSLLECQSSWLDGHPIPASPRDNRFAASTLQLLAVLVELAALSELPLMLAVVVSGGVLMLCRHFDTLKAAGTISSPPWRSYICFGVGFLGVLLLLVYDDSTSSASNPDSVVSAFYLLGTLLITVLALAWIAEPLDQSKVSARLLPSSIEGLLSATSAESDAQMFAFVAGIARANVLLLAKYLVELLPTTVDAAWLFLVGVTWLLAIAFETQWLNCAILLAVNEPRMDWQVLRAYLWTWIALGVLHGVCFFGELRNREHRVAKVLGLLLVMAAIAYLGQNEATGASREADIKPIDSCNGDGNDGARRLAQASECLLHDDDNSAEPVDEAPAADAYRPPAYLTTV